MPGNSFYFLGIFIVTAALSFILTKAFIKIAGHFNILDYPKTERKIHKDPVPLLGGAAIYLAWLLVILFLYFSGNLLDQKTPWSLLAWFLGAALVLIVNGILDDKYDLPAQVSVLGPVVASLMVIFGGIEITNVTHPAGGVLYLNNVLGANGFLLLWFPLLVTFLWLMSITYTTKLLDGIDGLTSSIGFIASLVIFVVSLSWDVRGSSTSLLTVTLAGSIFGFLFLNWHPAKIFLGEGGSTFIGFSLGVLAIISGSKIATALLVMGLPLLDIFWVIVRRLKRGQAFWRGDKEHLHFRLLAAGLSQRKVVIFLSTISLCFGLISIFFTTKAKIGALLILLVFMFILSTWLNHKLKAAYEES